MAGLKYLDNTLSEQTCEHQTTVKTGCVFCGGAHEYIGVVDAVSHNGFEYQTSAVAGAPDDCCGGLVANRLHWCGGCGLGKGMCNGSGHQTTTMKWWLGHQTFRWLDDQPLTLVRLV